MTTTPRIDDTQHMAAVPVIPNPRAATQQPQVVYVPTPPCKCTGQWVMSLVMVLVLVMLGIVGTLFWMAYDASRGHTHGPDGRPIYTTTTEVDE